MNDADTQAIEELYASLFDATQKTLRDDAPVPTVIATIYRDPERQPTLQIINPELMDNPDSRDQIAELLIKTGSNPEAIASILLMNVWISSFQADVDIDDAVEQVRNGSTEREEAYVFNVITPLQQGFAVCKLEPAFEKAPIKWLTGDEKIDGRFVRNEYHVQGNA